MDWDIIVTLSVTVLLALVGYFATYLNDLRLSKRKDRLNRVERQLKDLYGPLFSLIRVSNMAWDSFVTLYQADTTLWSPDSPPTEKDWNIWRLWMREVFMPLNLEMAKVVINHADLLEETEMPECLLFLNAHVQTYKAVIKAWDSGDYSRHTSIIGFPREELLDYTKKNVRYTKRKTSRTPIKLNHYFS